MDVATRRTVNMTTRFPWRWSLALLVAVGATVLVQWALAGDPIRGTTRPPAFGVAPAEPAPPAPVVAPPASGRRQEAVLAMPRGTFAKVFAVEPFCKGRLVWTYEDDRVSGTIECESEMAGASAELAIESEVALSSSGVVFGVITAVRLTELKINPQMLAGMAESLPVKVGPQIYPLVEPIVNDLLIDMPFSYHCRVRGDRMTISQARIGPSGPMAKYAMVVAPHIAGPIQAPALALEGTYTRVAEKEGPAPQKSTPSLVPTRSR
jgi:hypothetical protein